MVQFAPLEDRLQGAYTVADGGCWEWQRFKDRQGYGMIRGFGRNLRAHRAMLLALGRDVPDEMVVDHVCRNTSCVNPDHLEVVTHAVNTLRGVSAPAANARKTHCVHDHEFTPENTRNYTRKGKPRRQCRTCERAKCSRMAKQRRARRRLQTETA